MLAKRSACAESHAVGDIAEKPTTMIGMWPTGCRPVLKRAYCRNGIPPIVVGRETANRQLRGNIA